MRRKAARLGSGGQYLWGVMKNLMRAASVAALALAPLTAPASASSRPHAAAAGIDCPSGYVTSAGSPGSAGLPTAA
jgi:hypothetical protein